MHISLKPELLGSLWGLPITNSLLLSVLVSILVLGVGFFVARSLRPIPGKIQGIVESLFEAILNFMAETLGSHEAAKKYFTLVAGIFFLVLINNWMGILPGVGSVGVYESHGEEREFLPFLRSANSDLNITLALALISVIAVQIYGMAELGFFKHWGKFFVFTKGPIHFFVGLLELIGEFARVMSFSFRLFGNVFAGEVLLLIVMTLAPYIAPTPFLLLELFVGFIQALVFAMLSLIFLKFAIVHHEEEAHGH